MDKSLILNKYSNEEDRLLAAKILDKIKLAKTRNQIVNTDFLDMYQKRISQEVLNIEKEKDYTYYSAYKGAEKNILIIYPEKYNQIFANNRFDYSEIVKLIRITLPNELKGKYLHKDYLSGIMKLGVKREKVGDILVFENGADIIVIDEISKYILNNLGQLTRFSKSKIEELNINEIRQPEIKKEELRITVPSLRLDSIIGELANCSRTLASEMIMSQRVFVNYENKTQNSKLVKQGDVIVIRGKGKFNILRTDGITKKGKTVVIVEHYI
ncbi:MAG: YlmH/Sll1252 family protein [Clostridia bacterium]